MRIRSSAVAVVTALVLAALPSRAQVPAAPTGTAAVATVSDKPAEEPSVEERRIVAFVSTGVAVASLATGITMGVLAQAQFDCARDIIACNGTLENKVVGDELFDVRAEIDQRAILADMAFLFAGASAVVATVGYLRGFVFVEEEAAPAVAGIVLPQAPTFANLAPVAADVVVTP